MELLRFTVRNQNLSGGKVRLVSDSIDYVEASFDFRTDDWSGLSKWAHFTKDDVVYDINLVDDKITKDMHLNLGVGVWEVKLHGTDTEGTTRITTDTAYVTVESYGNAENENPLPEIPLSAAEQIDAKSQNALDTAGEAKTTAEEALDIAEQIREAAANGEFDGEDGAPGKTPEIQVGVITTLPPDAQAQFSIEGTAEKPIFNFAIPKGKTGDEGVGVESIIVSESDESGGTNNVIINLTDGRGFGWNVKNGIDGVGIESIETERTAEDGGMNHLNIILTNGEEYAWGIQNGRKGSDGKTGAPGLVWQGEWNEETSYSAIKDGQLSRDVVSYNGSSYVVAVNSTAPVKGVVPEGDTTGKWALLAEKGEPGEGGTVERLNGNTSNTTPNEVLAAINEGKSVLISHTDETYGTFAFSNFTVGEDFLEAVVASGYLTTDFGVYGISLIGSISNDTWSFSLESLARRKDIPESFEIPVFDLAELGLDAIPVTGGSGLLQTDTTAIQTALAKGPVGFVVPINMGTVVNATFIMNGAGIGGAYQCISMVNYTEAATITINVDTNGIQVIVALLKESVGLKEAAEVDLSGYEASGVVVETYADGSSLTHTFEFDADGRPTKRTDSNGGETIFTWG